VEARVDFRTPPRQISKRDRVLVVFLSVSLFIIFLRRPIALLNGWRGDQYFSKGRTREAIRAYRKGLLIDPRNAELHDSLGWLYRRRNLKDKAIAEYRKAIELKIDDPQTYFELGMLLFQKGDYGGAISHFQGAAERDPQDKTSYMMLAKSYERLGQIQKAISAWEKYLKSYPSDRKGQQEIERLKRLLR